MFSLLAVQNILLLNYFVSTIDTNIQLNVHSDYYSVVKTFKKKRVSDDFYID
jgi:hypothetical protein